VGFARVAGPDWLFTVERPKSEVMAAADRQYRDSLLFLGLLALASLAGAGWLAVRLGTFHRAVAERQAQLQTVLQQLPAGVVVVDTDGEVVIANERAADTLRTRPAPRPDDHGDITDVPEDDDELWPVMTAVGSRQPVDAELTVDRTDGTHILLVRSSPIFDGSRLVGAAGVFEDVTRRRNRERERRALTEVTARLASAATPADIGAVVVGPGADALGASAAMLQVRDRTEHDQLVLLALRGYPEEVRDEFGSARVTDDSLAAEVVRSGKPRFGGTAHPNGDDDVDGVPPADLDGFGGQPHPGWAAFPLQSAGRVVGVLTLGFDGVIEDLSTPRLAGFAAQVGQALDRAVRQEVEHDVALALQRSMLSPLDDAGPDIRIACRYRPAQDHLVVGGDFFDAISLPDGSALLAIGDIVGHGLDAAAAMGQLRSATRALALSSPSPESVLAHLDAFVARVPACRFASAALVHIDPGARCVTYSTAGHPPPLLRAPDGRVIRLDGAIGPPLGFAPARARPLATLALEPGLTTVCIYTDGLVERRDAVIDDHIDGLASLMSDPAIAHTSVDVVADHVLAVVGDEAPQRDDIALIFAEIHVT
jgi:PAS domain S-box-containing protein